MQRIREMQKYYRLCDVDILEAVPCGLAERALQWFQFVGRDARSLREFEQMFRERFVRTLDREDVYDELRNRTQAPEKKVANYLADVRCTIARFERPPSLAKQLRVVFRNLHPKFRHFLEGKSVRNFEDLGKFGIESERRRELDTLYLPPPPWGKSRIPAAAFRREESVASAASLEDKAVADARRRSVKADRKKRKSESVKVASGGGENIAVDVRVYAFVPANAPTSEVPQQSHTGMDLGRLISSALPAAHTVPPGGTVGPRRNMGNREGAGFKARYFLCKNVGHKQS